MNLMPMLAGLHQQVQRLTQRILNMHATGRVIRVDDSGPIQTIQVKLPMGEIIDVTPNAQTFGLVTNMPPDGDVTLAFLDGTRRKAYIVASNHKQHRHRGVMVGGTVVHDAGAETIILDPSGTVTITSAQTVIIKAAGKVRIEAPVLECTGEIVAKCDAEAIHLSTHKHKDVQSGGGQSGKPVDGS